MKIKKFNESANSDVEIRIIPIEVEIEFYIKKNVTGPDGDYYTIKAMLKDNFKDNFWRESEFEEKWAYSTTLGDYILKEDIDESINEYLIRVSKEKRTEKKYNI